MKSYQLFVAVSLLAASLPVHAESGDAAEGIDNSEYAFDREKWLDEVSVTAVKQDPQLRLSPLSVTVVDSTLVDRLNIMTMRGVSEIAPNFYMPQYGSRMTSSIYVRGIGARMDQPVIGLNVDNVPYLNKDAYDFDLPDVAKIEVLRGAQSTLYGRNTMAGLINIYTLSPLDVQGFRARVETGNGPMFKGSLAYYGKTSTNVGFSLSGQYYYNEGYWRNAYNGKKADGEQGGSLRWRSAWDSGHNFSLDNTMSFTHDRNNGYPYEYVGTGKIDYNDTCFYRRDVWSDGLTMKWIGNNWTIASITSAQYIHDNMTLDNDFLPKSYFTLTQARNEWNLTQDIVARGNVGSGYNWLTGLFGFYKRAKMHSPVVMKQDGIQELIVDYVNLNPIFDVVWLDDEMLLGSQFKLPVYGFAIYHQSDFRFDKWKFSVGARLDYEHSGIDYRSFADANYKMITKAAGIPMGPDQHIEIDESGSLSQHFLEFLPKVTLSYSLPMAGDNDVYLSVGKGYKSGGYNIQMFSDILQQKLMTEMGRPMTYDIDEVLSYKPEFSWNYELGAHLTCDEGRVNTDISLFYIDCRDQQLTMFPEGNTTGRITTNAGKTRSYGAELQIHYLPTERWQFDFSYGYTHARFVNFSDGINDFKGKQVPYAPSNTLFTAAAYTQPFSGWIENMTFGANLRAVGNIYWNEENSVKQPFYALLGASISARHKRLVMKLWADNLTGTHYNTFSFESMSNTFVQRGRPFTWGVALTLNI